MSTAPSPPPAVTEQQPHRVLVVGSGFGALFATQKLDAPEVQVTMVARTTHHLFQPLLYQVATGILSEGVIAPATRDVLARQTNARVLLGEVREIDLAARTVTADSVGQVNTFTYDSLIVAAGANQSWFGNDHFAEFAPGMKTIDDALELRGRIYGAFEMAEMAAAGGHTDRIPRLMTFVVVGAGPTGVEMAGQLIEMSRRTLAKEFRHIDPSEARIILLDAADEVLGSFGEDLATRTRRDLERLGIEVRLGAMVVDVDADGLVVRTRGGESERIEAATKVWAAGVQANPLTKTLSAQTGAPLDRAGRIRPNPDMTLPGHPEVFVVGDMVGMEDLPGVAQGAIQTGRHAADQILRRLRGQETGQPFEYHDKGSMATISRFRAVMKRGRIELTGVPAWLAWLAVHIFYIIGFKTQVTTLMHWAVSFVGRDRAERTVTEQQVLARLALEYLGEDFLRGSLRTPAEIRAQTEQPEKDA
ncbi:NAD(P)/FAD-dependent oxidoreductase [Ornithinimicrobium pekingense]|uniref:NADH:ubiquinone reductase (non-electrogenic) n=1 Tax=Ornithinimicrobium pekingense TaxID=384677 RepID=A0ABQ2FBB2_9MICO|nr:NAD(P)/FAD-dependent oxidoreductase [Ornithinimicrobium pekingense]GGK77576.1 NADH dehydrogenase [Ornithinimicrobium pekingense]